MKKRIAGLSLVMAMLLFSACGAWAAVTQRYNPVLTLSAISVPEAMKGDTAYSFDIAYESEDLTSIDWKVSPGKKDGVSFDFDRIAVVVDPGTGPTKLGSITFNVTATGHYVYITGESYYVSDDADNPTEGSKVLVVPSEDRTITATRSYTVRVNAWAPTDLSLDLSGAPEDGMEDEMDLDEIIDSVDKAGMLSKLSAGGLANVKFYSKATLPVTLSARGLPTGITANIRAVSWDTDKFVQIANSTNSHGSDDVEIYFTGTPTQAKVYDRIYLTVGNSAGQKLAGPFTMRVFEPAETTTTRLPDVTWGKEFRTKLTSKGSLSGTDFAVSWDQAFTDEWLATIGPGLKFDAETGELSGVIGSTDLELSADYAAKAEEGETLSNDLMFGSEKNVTVKIRFIAHSPTGIYPRTEDAPTSSADLDTAEGKELTFKLIGVAPTILSKDKLQKTFDDLKLYIGETDGKIASSVAAPNIKLKAKGPGKFTWTTTKLPAGFATSEDATDNSITLIASGDAQAIKNGKITFTAANGIGKDSFTLTINLSTSSDIEKTFKISADFLPDGAYKVGDSFDMLSCDMRDDQDSSTAIARVPLEAYPGPIKWTTKNLPKGITLSIDKSVSFDSKIWLKGHFDKATAKNLVYTVTARNTVYGTTATVSRSITVYDAPSVKTKSLPALTLGKSYSAKIDVNGLDASLDVFFTASGDTKGQKGNGFGKDASFDKNQADSGGMLKYDAKTQKITGTLYRFPSATVSKDKYSAYVIVTVRLSTPAFSGDVANLSKDLVIAVRGTAPKFTTTKIADFEGNGSNVDATGENHVITLTGTQSMDILAYIAANDAKKLGINVDENIPIEVTDADENASLPARKKLPSEKKLPSDKKTLVEGTYPAFTIRREESGTNNTRLMLGYAAGQGFALSGLPITISADNGASKPVVKVYKVNVTGASPVILSADRETEQSKDITVSVAAGTAINKDGENAVVLIASGDKPLVWSWSGQGKDFTVESEDNAATGTPQVTIYGTPKAGKETKTTVTVTLTNPQTKKKYVRKVLFVGMLAPDLSANKAAALKKEVEIGKSLNYKLSVKGSKPITWSISDDADADVSDYLVSIGLSFDKTTGILKGRPTGTTSDDTNHTDYVLKKLKITATNAAGSDTKEVEIGVKGTKPRLAANRILIQILSSDYSLSGDFTLKTSNISEKDEKSYVQWAPLNGKISEKKLSELRIATSETKRNHGEVVVENLTGGSGGDVAAIKNASIKISADNFGSTTTGAITVTVQDPEPKLTTEDNPLAITAQENSAATESVTITVDDDTLTGASSLTWKLLSKPTGNVKAAMRVAANKKSVTVTVTVPKGFSSRDIPGNNANDRSNWKTVYENSFSVSATNTLSKLSTTLRVSLDITPYDVTASSGGDDSGGDDSGEDDPGEEQPGDGSALPAENDAKPEETAEKDELPAGEGTVTYGEARGESTLTEAERTALSEGGYIIAAILPEVTTDESGQYDLEAVSLDEAAPEGYELVWFAFPRGVESSDDDAIAEFYDEAGAEVFAVPEGRKVVPSPWLEKEVTYAPVIAVKAPSAGNAKTSFDQAEEGDTVTVQAIEEAAEKSAEDTAETSDEPEKVSEESKHEEAAEK